ncbi:glycosyltransferase [Sporosarcina oncorhynchi]|uniref:Glycosyltransferase n=1 Tax=Sporosarcina oncorhynchi TaxID=3056444 RepID=A0ABZ0LAK8_9BACL|nr:glycosyltransferase [Sporosarcina sp. T2O-4]
MESVLKQSYKNIEILLINDGSTDNSDKICRKYFAAYECISLYKQKNGGLSDARNTGIKKATGEYIIFLDSDDFWENTLLETVVTELQLNNTIDYLFFRHSEYYETTNNKIEKFLKLDSTIISRLTGLEILSYILDKEKNFPWYACLAVIRRDFIEKNNLLFEVGRSYEDVIWTPTIFMKVENVRFIDKALYVYRRDRDGQITSQFSYKNFRDSIFVADYWGRNVSYLIGFEKLQNQIMINVIARYYFAIWFSGFLKKRDRHMIWRDIAEHRHLLAFTNTPIQNATKVLLNCIGLPSTSYLFKLLIKTKHFIVKTR